MNDRYILSRFPRFMLDQQALWLMEEGWIVHDAVSLRAAIRAIDPETAAAAPDSCEAFARAARADVAAWPCLYVHRLDPRHGAVPGQTLPVRRAVEGLRYVGDAAFVYAALARGESLARFRRVSVGGRNRYDMARPDPAALRTALS